MGGKTKTAQRTKNNVKPSSSSRSAELLGAPTTFVGFSAHSDLGLVPVAPGFSNTEQITETLDANISPQLQLIIRKMSKKDPLTRKKALQEFIELINEADVDTIKTLLPLWPKYYHNLATDYEHMVRELSQTVLQLLVSKCKRSIAPYLKQLIPVWLASQYDSYAPAASIATNTFRETFVGAHKHTEVCLHCQQEILDYATQNLTFHTADSLSTGKTCTPEEAEQKYQRIVIASLKLLSYFVEQTMEVENLTTIIPKFENLLSSQKFWSFSKNKLPTIKSAWFEFMYNLLQNQHLRETHLPTKSQIITICFKNIDEADPLVAPHVWGCILLLQTTYEDWHLNINFREAILPKITSLLRKGCYNNADAICPNLLPFLSKITQECLQDLDLNDFYKKYFDTMTQNICSLDNSSKSQNSIIIKSYFECVRFVLQRINNKSKFSVDEEKMALYLLNENIITSIIWFLKNEKANCKCYFQYMSALVAFWAERQMAKNDNNDEDTKGLYTLLLKTFWKKFYEIITEGIEQKKFAAVALGAGGFGVGIDVDVADDVEAIDYNEFHLERVVDILQSLHIANPSLEQQKVKFLEETNDENKTNATKLDNIDGNENETSHNANYVQNELKELVVQVVQFCLNNLKPSKFTLYLNLAQQLMKIYTDIDFYAQISEEKTLDGTLQLVLNLIQKYSCVTLAGTKCEILLDIIFDILQHLAKSQWFEFVDAKLLTLTEPKIQILVLERLLSYPFCVEPEVRTLLAKPIANELIVSVARDVVKTNSKENFNLLHKCFFQNDAGEILITQKTVDAILKALIETLSVEENLEYVDANASFVAQIMPVICNNENSTKSMQNEVFLCLFAFTIENDTASDFVSEDTIWELTTCWQDALSSGDIIITEDMLQNCAKLIEKHIKTKKDLTITTLNTISELLAKFIMCSTEKINDEQERLIKIDETMRAVFGSNALNTTTITNIEEYCIFLESLKGIATPAYEFATINAKFSDFKPLFGRTALNFTTIYKLVCRVNNEPPKHPKTPDDENTEDYCDPNDNLLKQWSNYLLDELEKYVNIATTGDCLIENACVDYEAEQLILICVERVKQFMMNCNDLVDILMQRLLKTAAKQENVIICRTLKFLRFSAKYTQFEESATMILFEELSDYFIAQNAFKAYVITLQYFMCELKPKSISTQSAIMSKEPSELWTKAAVIRCLIVNNFTEIYNETTDKTIIELALQFLAQISEKNAKDNTLLLYHTEIDKQPYDKVIDTVEFINLFIEVLNKFPHSLKIKNWDSIRIGISSWALSVSKTIENYADPKTSLFIVRLFKLFAELLNFILTEKQKSSTDLLKNVIEEWENLFAREVNLVLFKVFYTLCNMESQKKTRNFECFVAIIEEIAPTMELIDYSFVYNFYKSNQTVTLDNIVNFLLKNLSNPMHNLRMASVFIIRKLTQFFVVEDTEILEKDSDKLEQTEESVTCWHYLNRFKDFIERYSLPIETYNHQFSFKITEITELPPIDTTEAMSYLLLWDCIVYICGHSPVALRAIYTAWLNQSKFEENFFHFLFRAMPTEILKNYDSKIMHNDMFNNLEWQQLKERNLSLERYVCYLYTEVLRKLPAEVRKWWNVSQSRQKTFVDKLTTNYVSQMICNEELRSITNKKDKHENMQITVHQSTRDVMAAYTIDEARIELVIQLAPNYPLGGVKVECGKQIGGRLSARNFGMQLTIFLIHQNGTIFDGLSLWKKNLDKRFEGVEECYICYTVIHQDTCQLPKLSCKTCKKKFHGPCLYKWFTTSSKSTCPICRNVYIIN